MGLETDFKNIDLADFKEGCIFYEAPKTREIIDENDYCLAFLDGYPVTKGHTLIVPRRHVVDFFLMSEMERAAANDLLRIRHKELLR